MVYRILIASLLWILVGCSASERAAEYVPPSGSSDALLAPKELTGAPMRAVWVREIGDGTDWHAASGNLLLMGYDSADGKGSRVLHRGHSNYNKPLLSPNGQTIVFTDRSTESMYRLDWGSDTLSPIGKGYALDVWEDPSGKVWVYVGDGKMDNRGNLERVSRFPLEDPSARESVLDEPIARDNFQLGRSGRYAGGLFPAGTNGGVVDLETKEANTYGSGCWASLSPYDRGFLWIFDGRHRNLQFYASDRSVLPAGASDRWIVNISGAPGVDGARTYYPRWSNHPRFFAVSGPMPHGAYEKGEIYIGRFAEDFRSVEAWTRLTTDDRPDLFPDVWIDSKGGERSANTSRSLPAFVESGGANLDRISMEGTLVAKTRTPRPREILPYTDGLVTYRYQVGKVPETGEPGDIYVAHWAIRGEEVIRGFRREIGETYLLTLEPYAGNPNYEGARVVSDLNEGGENIYVSVSDD